MVKTLNLYDDIIILTESGTAQYVGSPLLEDDENQKQEGGDHKKEILMTFKEKVQVFKGDKDVINKVSDRLTQAKPKGAMGWLKFIATKVMFIVGRIIGKVFKFFAMLWKWIKEHVPGVQTIAEKVDKLLFKNKEGKDRGFTVGGEKIASKDLIGIGSTIFVLVGTLGYIAKKIKEKSEGGGAQEESTNIAIDTKPLILLESGGDVSQSFTKQAPGILSKVVDLIKNVKDAALSFFVKTLGMILVIGIFILLLILAQPGICKALKYTLGIEAAGVQGILSGGDKVKYVSAKVAAGIANALAKVANIDAFSTCDCVRWNKDIKRYVYNDGNGCKRISEISKEYKAKAQAKAQSK